MFYKTGDTNLGRYLNVYIKNKTKHYFLVFVLNYVL
jgi:hypothetical protein